MRGSVDAPVKDDTARWRARMRSMVALLSVSTVVVTASCAAKAQEPSGFERRKAQLIAALSDNGMGVTDSAGKFNIQVALARLIASEGADSSALDYLSRAADSNLRHRDWGDEGDFFFTWIGMARGLYSFGDRLSAAQEEYMREVATGFKRWFKGDTAVYPDHTNPVPGGTENHHLMTWSSLYLFAQYWPDARWYRDDVTERTLTSAEVMDRVRRLLSEHGRLTYSYGNVEFLSPTYEPYHWIPMANLFDFADDPRMRDIAAAFLAYHAGSLALNTFEGHILAPLTRNTTQSNTDDLAIGQYLSWLYWGHGAPSVSDIDDDKYGARQVFYLALSDWRPWPLYARIARGEVSLPFAAREVKPFWKADPPRYCMRSIYRDSLFAIGMGTTRTLPAHFVLNDKMISVVWSSDDRYNYLECFHPYWYSDKGEDFWAYPTSPFQRTLHHRTAAVVLFDIPESDPYRMAGWNEGWLANRDDHFGSLIHLGQCRYPGSVDHEEQRGAWHLVREGEVYVGIRPFGGSVEKTTVGNFRVIKNRGAATGFVFEVGTRERFGSLDTFAARLAANPFSADVTAGSVTYRSCEGTTLRMAGTESSVGPDNSVPTAWIDDEKIDYASWPVMQSPYVEMVDGVLTAQEGDECHRIDWRGEYPVIRSGGCGARMSAAGTTAPVVSKGVRRASIRGIDHTSLPVDSRQRSILYDLTGRVVARSTHALDPAPVRATAPGVYLFTRTR